MILRTQDIHPETNDRAIPRIPASDPPQCPPTLLQPALDLAAEVAARYEISALSGLLASARASLGQDEISVAVLGRFKAGKSSFLNHFIGRGILPVGVVPVTAVVTEIRYGPREEARVHHRDGRDPEVPLDRIGGYISEKENPENTKQVDLITVELPELRRFRGLKFVDTPGLESALSHNTQTSLDWLPNVGLALVAVSVDPPLSQRDIDLLKSLYQYTPKVAVLLTKADLLSEPELAEVVEFVRAQLAKNFPGTPRVFPYSTKPGFERFRQALEAELVSGTLERFAEERESILAPEDGYPPAGVRGLSGPESQVGRDGPVGAPGAEAAGDRREGNRRRSEVGGPAGGAIRRGGNAVHGQQSARDAPERTGARAARSLRKRVSEMDQEPGYHACVVRRLAGGRLARGAYRAFDPGTRLVPAAPAQSAEAGIPRASTISRPLVGAHHAGVRRAVAHHGNRDPRRGAQHARYPGRAGIRQELGTVVARLLPVWTIKAVVHRHFARTISYLIYQNLSRLSTQWEESINGALWGVEKEARRRLDELIGTVERLVESGGNERAPQLRADLERLEKARKSLAAETGS